MKKAMVVKIQRSPSFGGSFVGAFLGASVGTLLMRQMFPLREQPPISGVGTVTTTDVRLQGKPGRGLGRVWRLFASLLKRPALGMGSTYEGDVGAMRSSTLGAVDRSDDLMRVERPVFAGSGSRIPPPPPLDDVSTKIH